MSSSIDDILKEIKLLREEIHEIREILIPEVEPSPEEIKAIEHGREEYKKGKYIKLSDL